MTQRRTGWARGAAMAMIAAFSAGVWLSVTVSLPAGEQPPMAPGAWLARCGIGPAGAAGHPDDERVLAQGAPSQQLAFLPILTRQREPALELVAQVDDKYAGPWPFLVGAPMGDLLYVGEDDQVGRYDVSDPRNPRDVGPPPFAVDGPIAFAGSTAYVAQASYGHRLLLSIYSLADPERPALLGELWPASVADPTLISYITGLTVAGDRVFMSGGLGWGCPALVVADVSDPRSPRLAGSADWCALPFNPRDAVAIDGRTIVLAGGDCHCDVCWEPSEGYLLLLQADGSGDLRELGHLTWSDATTDVALDRGLAYVAAGEAGLRIVDLADPGRPREIGWYDTGDAAERVVVAWPLAFVSYGGWLAMLDVDDPAHARALQFVDLAGDIRRMVWYREHLWISSDGDGLLGYVVVQ